jgi:hypothetical protein
MISFVLSLRWSCIPLNGGKIREKRENQPSTKLFSLLQGKKGNGMQAATQQQFTLYV